MAMQIALPRVISFTGGSGSTGAAAPSGALADLLARYGARMRRRRDAARLRELDAHLARDIGVTPADGGRPEGFAVDTRPVWSIGLIGLALRPMDGAGRAVRRGAPPA
jgi:uncharacterized protein YjiS (DUF1127 family)